MNFQVLLNCQSFRILICMWDVDICNTLQHSTTHCNTLGGANRFGVGVEIPHLTFSYSYIATWMCATHCNTTHCNTTHCNTTCGTWIFLSPCQSTHRCFFWFVDYTLFFLIHACATHCRRHRQIWRQFLNAHRCVFRGRSFARKTWLSSRYVCVLV